MADDSIRVEYNQELTALEDLLTGVERAGDFFVSGAVEIPLPKVEVEGVGVLSFPVPPVQIDILIKQATRAPYGRGTDTIVDETVRKVWQLPSGKVRLSGKSWASTFDGILQQVVRGLGCEGLLVSAELYKLLVYDTGGFFLAHRDTEKADGMFGTLVVVLPAAHRGGELAIRHLGREVTVDLSGAEVSEVCFAAFYADCEHEVRAISEGHRVCLVYNLIGQRAAQGASCPTAPDYEKQIAAVAALLKENLSRSGAPLKIAWLLEHQYSCESLSFAGLKAADAARVKVLAQAADRSGCVAHLGIVHIEESGIAEPTYPDYGRRRRWGRYEEDEDEEEESTGGDFEVVEVCDGRHYINHWRDLHDQPVDFGEIPMAPGELLPDGALDAEKPDEQRLMEATGNEGASFERRYRRAALVLWRRESYAEVLLQAGVAAALPLLQEHLRALKTADRPLGARKEAVALAQMLVKASTPLKEEFSHVPTGMKTKRVEMLRMLNELGDVALLEIFVAKVVTREYDGSDNPELIATARLLGPGKAGPQLVELMRRQVRTWHVRCVDLLHLLGDQSEFTADRAWRRSLHAVAEAVLGQLDEIGKQPAGTRWDSWGEPIDELKIGPALVADLLTSLDALHASDLCAAAASRFIARPEVFDPVTILVPALGLIERHDEAAILLWEHSAAFLLWRSGSPPNTPRDWRQEANLACSCDDCRELRAFAVDPVQQIHRFRVRKDRRQHLHQRIESHGLEMTHVTERIGSPQTLVCEKDRRGYQRRCAQYRKDIEALAALVALAGRSAWATASLKEIETARELAAAWVPSRNV